MALTTKERDDLPASDFAVPGKRQLPIHDETHVRMAHDMINKTEGLTSEEKAEARRRILSRAHKLGVDTSEWQAEDETHMSGMMFHGMAIEMPHVKNHPNKLPFSGILTRLNTPSDNPLNGSHGKRVVLTEDAAQEALPSLMGMSIDFTKDLDGHDPRSKIGVITAASIKDNAIYIEGFFYVGDYPSEVKNIQANKAALGFSYEIQHVHVRDMNADPLVIDSCVFTGAAVLFKDCAAYESTSLAAKAVKPESKFMSAKDENDVVVMDEIKKLKDQISKLEKAQKKDQREEGMHAGSVLHMVKPHADKLRACADGMCAAGMGMHPKGGHVKMMHDMADQMESDAIHGKLPHIYQTSDFYNASSQEPVENEMVKSLKASLDSLTTQITDLKKGQFHASEAPARKTLPPSVTTLLAKSGIGVPKDDEKLSLDQLNKAFNAMPNLTPAQRIAAKIQLSENGQL